METVQFKVDKGIGLYADIHLTESPSKKCLIFLHGGALLIGSREDLPSEVISFLNQKGWDVASLDYRVAPEHDLQTTFEDVVDGCKFVHRTFPGSKLILAGYSAGAYLALLNGAKGYPVDGICSFAGYGNLSADWYFEPSPFFLSYKNVDYIEQKLVSGELFITTDERVDLYIYLRQKGLWPKFMFKDQTQTLTKEFSPIFHLTEKFPKTVLVHGDSDVDVPSNASKDMAEAFKNHDILSKCFILKDEGHDLFKDINNPTIAKIWSDSLAFLE